MTTGQAVPNARVRPASGRQEGDLLRNAFRRRTEHVVEHIASSASPEALARALSAPTDFGALASALGDATIPLSALELDPLSDAVARGAGERARLSARAGAMLSAEQAGQALGGISRQAVDKRRRANQLLAVRVASDWRYPAIQIGADGQVPQALPPVLASAAEAGMSAWATLDFLLAPDDAIGGLTPLEALRRGGEPAASVQRLLEAARSDAFG